MEDDWINNLPRIHFEEEHNFGPVTKGRNDVFGCAKPSIFKIREWIQEVRNNDISKVVVLCEPHDYSDFINKIEDEFGQTNVLRATVKDYHLCEKKLLNDKIIPFIDEAIKLDEKVVVHCNAGYGRTGHVLAAWLYHNDRSLNVNEALQEVRGKGIEYCQRNPLEAVKSGHCTMEELEQLILSTRK